jgi:hypothetical protein
VTQAVLLLLIVLVLAGTASAGSAIGSDRVKPSRHSCQLRSLVVGSRLCFSSKPLLLLLRRLPPPLFLLSTLGLLLWALTLCICLGLLLLLGDDCLEEGLHLLRGSDSPAGPSVTAHRQHQMAHPVSCPISCLGSSLTKTH